MLLICSKTSYRLYSFLSVFFAAISVFGKTSGISVVCLVVRAPWPATKLSFTVIAESLMNIDFGIHNKRSVAHYRLVDRFAFEQQKVTFAFAVLYQYIALSVEFDPLS